MAASLLVACTGEDPLPVSPAADAGPGQSSSGSTSGNSSSGGADSGPVCQPGAKACVGSVPRTCDANGAWHDEAACTGAAPICSAGACVSFRLHGGIGTMGVAPAPAGSLRLKDNGLEQGKRTCAGSLCVTGGIAP